MGFSVRELLKHPVLVGASLVTGQEGLDEAIEQVAPFNCRALWDSAGKRVLTLYEPHLGNIHDDDEVALPFADGRVSAIVCRSNDTDSLPASLVWSCNRYSIPLILLSPERNWEEIYPPLFGLLNEDAGPDPVREAFVRVTLSGGGMHGILELLRFMVDNPVVLTSPSLQMIDHSGRNRYLADLDDCMAAITHAMGGATELGEPRFTAHCRAAEAGEQCLAYLAVVEAKRKLSPIGLNVLRRAAELAGWQHIHDSRRRMDWHARTHFLSELLLGRFTSINSARTWAGSLGIQLASKYLVIVVAIDDYEAAMAHREPGVVTGVEWIKERIADIVEDAVAATGTSSLSVGFSDSVAAAIGLAAAATPREANQTGRKLAARVRSSVQTAFRDVTVTVGIGPMIASVADLPKGYSQARQVAALGRIMHGRSGIHALSDLGFFRLLSRMDDLNFLSDFAKDLLGPLEVHDASGQAPILPTLEAFLAADGNRLRCANELYLHPNTVSYRLGLVEKLIGLSPFRSEDRFLIQSALKVRQYLRIRGDDGLPAPLYIAGAAQQTSGRQLTPGRRSNTVG